MRLLSVPILTHQLRPVLAPEHRFKAFGLHRPSPAPVSHGHDHSPAPCPLPMSHRHQRTDQQWHDIKSMFSCPDLKDYGDCFVASTGTAVLGPVIITTSTIIRGGKDFTVNALPQPQPGRWSSTGGWCYRTHRRTVPHGAMDHHRRRRGGCGGRKLLHGRLCIDHPCKYLHRCTIVQYSSHLCLVAM